MQDDAVMLEIVDEATIGPKLDAEIRQLLVQCFPHDHDYYSKQRWWHSRPAWTVIARAHGELISHLAMIERTVLVSPDKKPVRIAGVQCFCVKPGFRGIGLSDKVMAAAIARTDERGLDAGLLFCLPVLEKIYNRMGWRKIDARAFIQDEEGVRQIPSKNIIMACPAEKFPSGDIDLAGDDW